MFSMTRCEGRVARHVIRDNMTRIFAIFWDSVVMTEYVFPCLWVDIIEVGRRDSNDIAILVMSSKNGGRSIALREIVGVPQTSCPCQPRSFIPSKWVEIEVVYDFAY